MSSWPEKSIFSPKVKTWYLNLLQPLTRTSLRFGIHPHVLTIMGLVIIFLSAFLFGLGTFRWAGLLLLIGSSCDVLDGHLARISGTKSSFGAILDSTLDRYSEIAIFLGLTLFYLTTYQPGMVIITILALDGSVMVSYVRARAEGLGHTCSVGIMQRPERIVLLGVGALLGEIPVVIAITVIAALANFTALYRLYYIWKQTS